VFVLIAHIFIVIENITPNETTDHETAMADSVETASVESSIVPEDPMAVDDEKETQQLKS
jgi:hypothetical protein